MMDWSILLAGYRLNKVIINVEYVNASIARGSHWALTIIADTRAMGQWLRSVYPRVPSTVLLAGDLRGRLARGLWEIMIGYAR